MISIAGLISPTRLIAPAGYVFALVSCTFAWIGDGRDPRRRRLAVFLAVLEALLLLDVVFNGRWRLHDLLENVAKASNLYVERAGPQHVALGLVGSVVAAGIGLALILLRGRPGAALAACGGILSLGCWWVEVISLHSVDALLYRSVYGVIVVRLAWAVCSLMVGTGILWDRYALTKVGAMGHSSANRRTSLRN
jgi:hypothetical protein